MLLQPSLRAIAYLRAFESLGIVPGQVILLRGAVGPTEALRAESDRFGYGARFFDPGPDILDSLEDACAVVRIGSDDINCSAVRRAVRGFPGRYVVFSASGILGRWAFSSKKRFIHVHPGLLPDYRGSTCFYYSLLETGHVGSTAFFMDAGIDTGEIIAASKFTVNYSVQPGQRLFMDYILDPYIRAATLKKVLAEYLRRGDIGGLPQPAGARPAYHVMHPILRRLALRSLVARYDASQPSGVFDLWARREPGWREHA